MGAEVTGTVTAGASDLNTLVKLPLQDKQWEKPREIADVLKLLAKLSKSFDSSKSLTEQDYGDNANYARAFLKVIELRETTLEANVLFKSILNEQASYQCAGNSLFLYSHVLPDRVFGIFDRKTFECKGLTTGDVSFLSDSNKEPLLIHIARGEVQSLAILSDGQFRELDSTLSGIPHPSKISSIDIKLSTAINKGNTGGLLIAGTDLNECFFVARAGSGANLEVLHSSPKHERTYDPHKGPEMLSELPSVVNNTHALIMLEGTEGVRVLSIPFNACRPSIYDLGGDFYIAPGQDKAVIVRTPRGPKMLSFSESTAREIIDGQGQSIVFVPHIGYVMGALGSSQSVYAFTVDGKNGAILMRDEFIEDRRRVIGVSPEGEIIIAIRTDRGASIDIVIYDKNSHPRSPLNLKKVDSPLANLNLVFGEEGKATLLIDGSKDKYPLDLKKVE